LHVFFVTAPPRPHLSRQCGFPQQLPGPAQPACPGSEPQQAVSPGPGYMPDEDPVKEDEAESILLRLLLLQDWHIGV